ncbi:MAG: acyl carrier protein [Acidobacteriota bacterium]
MTSTREEILAGVRQVAAEHLDHQGPLPLDAHLVEDLQLDSLQLMTLAAEVENHFRVLLEPEDEEAIATVRDLVDVVRHKKGGAS